MACLRWGVVVTLEGRIRELCAQAVANANRADELQLILSELKRDIFRPITFRLAYYQPLPIYAPCVGTNPSLQSVVLVRFSASEGIRSSKQQFSRIRCRAGLGSTNWKPWRNPFLLRTVA